MQDVLPILQNSNISIFFINLHIINLQVMDIILHCLDPGHLKMKPLNEVFPAVCRFNQVSHMINSIFPS